MRLATFCLAALLAAAGAGHAATLTILASFAGDNGGAPAAGLVIDGDGTLYGTTSKGGMADRGTVFAVAKEIDAIIPRAMFFGGTDGADPLAPLVVAADGTLYGTTPSGGSKNQGTVFMLPKGTRTKTILAEFTGGNGAVPLGGLTADAQGNLFGSTLGGGGADKGTVFVLPKGAHGVMTLASFTGGGGGANPVGRLVLDAEGNLFGTTVSGGEANKGTVFTLAKGSRTVTTLASLSGGSAIINPASRFSAGLPGGLVADAEGNLFGTTQLQGGDKPGTVFMLAKGSHAVTNLANFGGFSGGDAYGGGIPTGGLIVDARGNLFGTTISGGMANNGTVFVLPKGSRTIVNLVSFNNGDQGGNPTGGLVADAQGNLFGTTLRGGAKGHGTVFEVTGSGFAALPATGAGSHGAGR